MSMLMPIAAVGDYFKLWQLPLVLLLIGLIIFWKIYRSKQM